MTWHDVKASHETDNPEVVIGIDDIYGLVILLAIGLGGASVVLTLELLLKPCSKKSMKNNRVAHGNYLLLKFFHNFPTKNIAFYFVGATHGPFQESTSNDRKHEEPINVAWM